MMLVLKFFITGYSMLRVYYMENLRSAKHLIGCSDILYMYIIFQLPGIVMNVTVIHLTAVRVDNPRANQKTQLLVNYQVCFFVIILA